jgi:DNA-binding transcriptional ArsR family regulator
MRRDVFQAIADPTRREILMLISSGSMTPNAVAEEFNKSRQAVSKHIKILTECKLLKKKKTGREIHYYVNPDKIWEIDAWLNQFRNHWESRFGQLDHILSKLKTNRK